MKNKILIVTLLLLLILLLILIFYNKKVYYIILDTIINPLIRNKNKFFIENFEDIIKPYLIEDVKLDNKIININRNVKNEYAVLDKSITNGILDKLNENDIDEETLNVLLSRVVKYVNKDGNPVNVDDLIIVDVLNTEGNYFPYFHTDIEWLTFCENDGFQIWILLKDDEKIKPRGKMFIMETDIVEPGRCLEITKEKVNECENNSSHFYPTIINEYQSLKDINPKIKYLNSNIGEVFIMNPNVYHCSDTIVKKTTRKAINMRIIHKPENKLKLCSKNNLYSKIAINKNITYNCDVNNCYIIEENKNIKNKYL